MAEVSDDDKTEEPTDKKREDSRNDGMVSMSREVLYLFSIGAMLTVFFFGGRIILEQAIQTFRFSFENFNSFTHSNQALLRFFGINFNQLSFALIPILIILFVLGVLGGVIQVGIQFTWKPLIPKFEKINPIQGFGKIFGKRMFAELFIVTTKCCLIAYISYMTIDSNMRDILNSAAKNSRDFFTDQFDILWEFTYRLFFVSVFIALIDFAYRKWEHETKMKMSKQEIKDEIKQSEGDPFIRAKIRETQRKMSQARMLQEVPKADVIITNPQHYAVVLKYDKDTMISPSMTGKGIDFLALRIMDIATQNNVPIVRNPPVARALYAQMEIGDEIPEDFYKIIAEILAFVYKQKRKTI